MQPPNAQEAVPMGLDIPPADWQQTPPSVQTLVLTLLKRLEAVEARLTAGLHHVAASALDGLAVYKGPQAFRRRSAAQSGWATWPSWASAVPLGPTETRVLTPPQCVCGHTALTVTRPYHTHQVIELPPSRWT